jgi:hypothetical protein
LLPLLIYTTTCSGYLRKSPIFKHIIFSRHKISKIYIAIYLLTNNPCILGYGVHIHTPELLRYYITKVKVHTTLVARSYHSRDLNTKVLIATARLAS